MSYLINNQQKINDIIFADRNKEYGAYLIRSTYGNTIFKSLSFMLIGVGTVAAVAFFMSNRNKEDSDLSGQLIINDSAIYVIPFNAEEEKHEEKATEKKHEEKTTENAQHSGSEILTVIDSTFDSDKTSTITASSGTSTVSNDDPTKGSIASGTANIHGGNISGPDTSNKVSQPYEVDSAPEFEGGLSALYRFVGQNLKYPGWASGEGKEGTVFVKFVVDEHGKVGALSLLNSIGYGMDDEALRVVSLIPKFKTPAKVKGIPVKVYYQIPIRFRFKY